MPSLDPQHDELLKSIRDGDVARVQLLLDAGVDPWARECQANVDTRLFGGPSTPQLKRALLAAAKASQPETAKPALGIVRAKTVQADAGGMPLIEFMYGQHWTINLRQKGEWSIICVNQPIQAVADEYSSIVAAVRHEQDVANVVVYEAMDYSWAIQLDQSEWTLVVRNLGDLNDKGIQTQDTETLALSCQLNTRALAFYAAERIPTSVLKMAENGRFVDHILEWNGIDECETMIEDERVSKKLSELGVLVPSMTIQPRGYEAVLNVRGIKKSDVLRLDYFATSEW